MNQPGVIRARFVAPALIISALLIWWEAAADRRDLIPPPSAALRAMWRTRDALSGHLVPTIGITLAGAAAGVIAGLVVALAICAPVLRRRPAPVLALLRPALEPLVVVSQTVPFVALAPLLPLWFGFGPTPKVVLVALITFFPVAIAAIAAVDAVEGQWRELVLGFGGGPAKLVTAVLAPAAAPGVFAGLRISLAYAVGAAVLAEGLGASSGLGVYLERSRRSFRYDQVLAATFIISALSILAYALVGLLERWACPWLRADTDPTHHERNDP